MFGEAFSCSFVDLVAKKSFHLFSVFFRGFRGKKSGTRLLTFKARRCSYIHLAGLRTQGREPVGSASRGDFPAVASVLHATLVPQYRCASVPESHRIPDYHLNTVISG